MDIDDTLAELQRSLGQAAGELDERDEHVSSSDVGSSGVLAAPGVPQPEVRLPFYPRPPPILSRVCGLLHRFAASVDQEETDLEVCLSVRYSCLT
eukprot:COSAG03_NODE_502_length_7397_cov_43.776469_4_plen_95_part_00